MKVKHVIERLREKRTRSREDAFSRQITAISAIDPPANRVIGGIFINESENRGYLENRRLIL